MTPWTPVAKQSETWTEQTQAARVFDPYVFDRDPVFDTGSRAGLWDAKSVQVETWTVE